MYTADNCVLSTSSSYERLMYTVVGLYSLLGISEDGILTGFRSQRNREYYMKLRHLPVNFLSTFIGLIRK